jgi:O-antigen ligase
MIKEIYRLETFYILTICLIPVSLLISSGAAELFIIIISTFFLINFYYIKNKTLYNIDFILLLIFWLFLILNLLFSLNKETSFTRNFFFFRYILYVFSLIFIFNNKKNFNLALTIWLIVTTVVAFDIFFEFFNKKNILGFESYDPSRIASFLGKELKIGYYMFGFSFISIGYLIDKSKKNIFFHRFFIILLMLFFTTSVILTGERSNTIKFIISLIIFIFFSNSYIFNKKKLILLMILISLIATYLFTDKLRDRAEAIIVPIKDNGVIEAFKQTQHASHYYTAIEIFKKYPLFGIGNKNFREECVKDIYYNKEYKYTEQRCTTHPHQIYLEFLSEHGLIGSATMLFIIFYITIKGIKIYRKNNSMVHLGSISFILTQFLPLLPSGSFFTSWSAIIFWTNFAILLFYNNKNFLFFKKSNNLNFILGTRR